MECDALPAFGMLQEGALQQQRVDGVLIGQVEHEVVFHDLHDCLDFELVCQCHEGICLCWQDCDLQRCGISVLEESRSISAKMTYEIMAASYCLPGRCEQTKLICLA